MENEQNKETPPPPPPEPDSIAAADDEMTKAKARIAELEAAANDTAQILEIGRKQHRAELRSQLLGSNGKLVADAGEAFDLIVATTAAKLEINIDRPLSIDDKKRLVASVYPLARPLLVTGRAGAPPSTSPDPITPPRKRGL
jgi:hypothetical protein